MNLMIRQGRRGALLVRLLAGVGLAIVGAGCAGNRDAIPPNVEPDRYLFEQGEVAMTEEKWLVAREYFRQVVDGYPQSPYRADAKLGIGDAFFNEDNVQGYILAAAEYREFLSFFPTHQRADYAQYRVALTFYEQMPSPDRDQTATIEALSEFEAFFERYPNSALVPEASDRQREARDRLSESEYQVGVFYYRAEWYPGAILRLRTLLEDDPDYTRRDGAYFHLAESYMALNQQAAALPLYERLLNEFEVSQYLEQARQRVSEISISPAPQPTPPAATPPAETAPADIPSPAPPPTESAPTTTAPPAAPPTASAVP